MQSINTIKLSHIEIKNAVKSGDICIDATMGRGRDTLLLCNLVGKDGKIYSFDIQNDAIKSTEELLNQNNIDNATLILDGHENMDRYVKEKVSCVVFNFGYLPGGDRSIQTKAKTSIIAIEKALKLLKENGIISICIYYGKDSGYEEKDKLIEYLKTLDSKEYTVIMSDFLNRGGCPPIFVKILKGI